MNKKALPYILIVSFVLVAFLLLVYRSSSGNTRLDTAPPLPYSETITDVDYYSFCKNPGYCSMGSKCEGVPLDNHGVCESEQVCNDQYLCAKMNDVLKSNTSITFLGNDNEFIGELPGEEGMTRLGYILIGNSGVSDITAKFTKFECLDYDDLCDKINVVYPSNVPIESNDVVISPLYVKKSGDLEGLVSLEFTLDNETESKMFNVDTIFNGDKTCIYQWGNLDSSRSNYFEEPSNVDWLEKCE